MTVKELVAKLQTYDLRQEIVVDLAWTREFAPDTSPKRPISSIDDDGSCVILYIA